MKSILKSKKLDNVCYDIRGPLLEHAKQMEERGEKIIKLNLGNTAPFGFMAPPELVNEINKNLIHSSGYVDSKGILEARTAIAKYSEIKNIKNVSVNDIYIGNGVSELIVMAMQALLNEEDEVLIPSPDYPLWSAAVRLGQGIPRYYQCDEEKDWLPNIEQMASQINNKTKAIVIINPNNPTGALYSNEILLDIIALARKHQLMIFSDEIYDKILYDENKHTSIASLANDIFFITMNGLSKNYRACGYRCGWMVLSGKLSHATNYIEGLNVLASMRLCANVPAQHAIKVALFEDNSINQLVAFEGRLNLQRLLAYKMLNAIPGVSCNLPKAALYIFFKLDPSIYPIDNDQEFLMNFLKNKNVLLVQGSGFNYPKTDHYRLVFLPSVEELAEAIRRLENFLLSYNNIYGKKK